MHVTLESGASKHCDCRA